ncbi:MAG: hypothetical protein K0R88_1050 [Solirubrobacterales bacterium]|jgi:hypothetical protein|nr:hypothetical protein [Solirubrobacterales bacterium]
MRLEPPVAHLLGIPLEEFVPVVLALGTALGYLRLLLGSGWEVGR